MSRRRRQVSGLEESGFEVRSRDLDIPPEEYARRPKFPVVLVLDNLRSAFNVGALFRVADTARLAGLLTCGHHYARVSYPRPVALVLGNEALGVQPSVLESCDELIEVPVFGFRTPSTSPPRRPSSSTRSCASGTTSRGPRPRPCASTGRGSGGRGRG